MASFRDRLLATVRAIQPVLSIEGVMIVGSEVPNLLEADAASTLVVSQDVDVLVPIDRHAEVVAQLGSLVGIEPSSDEPSVWVPTAPELIEVNFLGQDPALIDPSESYAYPHDRLPLMVFGALGWLRSGEARIVDGARVPLPRIAGLLLEKLATDRTGIKADRDLLVALGLVLVSSDADLDEARALFVTLPPEARHAIRTNTGILSVLPARPGVPDPGPHRARIAALLASLPGDDR